MIFWSCFYIQICFHRRRDNKSRMGWFHSSNFKHGIVQVILLLAILLQSQYLSFTQVILVSFMNFVCYISNTNVYKQMKKAATHNLPWALFCDVNTSFRKILLRRQFLVTFLVLLLSIHVQIFFHIISNSQRIFFQAALVGCFFKGKMSNKQSRVLLLHTNKCYVGRFFIPSLKYLFGKLYPTMGNSIITSRLGDRCVYTFWWISVMLN